MYDLVESYFGIYGCDVLRESYESLGEKRYIPIKKSEDWVEDFINEARAMKKYKPRRTSPRAPVDERPKAIVLMGRPATGKTKTVEKIRKDVPNLGHHELDISRKETGKSPAYFGQDLMAHHNAGIRSDAERGNPIVVSNTSIPRAHRRAAVDNLTNLGYNAIVALPPTSARAANRRNRNRTGTEPGSSQVPGFVMRAMGRQMRGINTNPRGGGALSRKDLRAARAEYKKLHKQYRFTKPAMRRAGIINE